jgi:tRNA(Ile)-lysidine synthase TilS/MesJ
MPEFDLNFPFYRTCQHCVLPEDESYINLDEKGACNVCASQKEASSESLLETDFLKIIDQHKDKKSRYDCLIMCSGGKDSVYSLYYLVKKCRLNPLVFTFDHYFENDQAMNNVQRAVEKLGVDFIFLRTGYMHEAFREVLRTDNRASICQLCSIWYIQEAHRIASTYQTPVVVAGWTKGQASMNKKSDKAVAPEYRKMTEGTKEFIINVLRKKEKYKKFPATMKEVLKISGKRYKLRIISPHWFIDLSQEEYVDIIKKELDWEAPKESYPKGSSNCLLNFLSVYKSLKDFGYTHYHIELSNLIRQGEMTKTEAEESLKPDFDKDLLKDIYNRLFKS